MHWICPFSHTGQQPARALVKMPTAVKSFSSDHTGAVLALEPGPTTAQSSEFPQTLSLKNEYGASYLFDCQSGQIQLLSRPRNKFTSR